MTFSRARTIGANDAERVAAAEADLLLAIDVITDDPRFTPSQVDLYHLRIEQELQRRHH